MQDGIVGYAWNTDDDSINKCSFTGKVEGIIAGRNYRKGAR